MKQGITVFIIIALLQATSFCYKTENVHILIIDGARYSETFGDTLHKNIPCIWNTLRPQGAIYTRFYNDSLTYTTAGHSSIISGTWQNIPNDDSQRPNMPTIFECFRKYRGTSQTDNYVILGKDKLRNLSYSSHAQFGNAYSASVMYSSSQYNDTVAWSNLQTAIKTSHPKLTITNFGGIDYWGHMGEWERHINSIKFADSVINKFWTDIQSDPVYKDKTTLIVTNDHGRHSNDWMYHGDGCEGCRHIMLFMIGPDMQPGLIDSTRRSQIDIAPTVAELLDFAAPYCTGTSIIPVSSLKTPILLTPSNGDTIQTNLSSVSWETIAGAEFYHIQMSTDSLFTSLVLNDSGCITPVRNIDFVQSSQNYYWRVRAINKTSVSRWSFANSFTTAGSSRFTPTVMYPVNNFHSTTDSIRFSWNYPVQSSSYFHFVIAKDSLMKNIIYSDSSIVKQELLYTLPLNNRSFWWKVRAFNPKTGWSGWSQTSTFSANFIEFTKSAPAFSINFFEEGKTGNSLILKYTLPEECDVLIRIHTIDGSLVRSFPAVHQKAAYYERSIDKSLLSKAVYILDFSSQNYKASYRFVID
jgi:hypothetical protein